jgi:aldose 1-epimerase
MMATKRSLVFKGRKGSNWIGGAIVGLGLLGLGGCNKAQEPPAAQPEPAPAAAPLPVAPPAAEPAPVVPALPAIQKEPWGEHDGKTVYRYTLTNANQLVLRAVTYGAIITELHVPSKSGELADVVLGRDTLADYVKETPYFGATIGRVANRIKNGQFELEGKKYSLAKNDGPNHLHGGKKGWDKVLWSAEAKETSEGPQLIFTYTSLDGDEAYPGTVQATTIYTLTQNNELKVEMRATTDKTTLVNMAHHSYWNLGGHTSKTIEDHELTLNASHYTPAVALVPGGEVKAVLKTPFDFTKPKLIGQDLRAVGGTPIGFDHNWVVDGDPHALREVARLKHPGSGRVMTLHADQPGVQFYSGNFLDGKLKGKGGIEYPQYSGLCLESQKFPNSVNVPSWRNEVILKPGQEYKHVMIHKFTAE